MIAIIDYGLGNLMSVQNALNKLEIPSEISNNPGVLEKSKALILPGVGAAGEGMKNLRSKHLDKVIFQLVTAGKPILGICLGMQLLFNYSEEGNVKCLGLLKGQVKKFSRERKVPQIGWNEVGIRNKGKNNLSLFDGIPDGSYFYFVNSYYCQPEDNSIIAAMTEYGERFPSVIVKNNIIATQFHPEKSSKTGFNLLKNIFNAYYVN